MDITQMTLKQKLGQLLVTGFPGPAMSGDFKRLVRDWGVGNVILFKYNERSRGQLAALCADLTAYITEETGVAPLISSDEEGGVVSRLPADMPKMPSAMAQAALEDEARVRRAACLTARELRAVGINFNLAPVLDVNNDPANPVIGVRSYGTDAETVSRFALAALAGYGEGGILTSGKHFPGHGDTQTDSHLALPVIRKSRGELEALELIPFRRAIAAGVPAVTIAHILFPALEPEGVPATMSRRIITGLLREELGFAGLAVSDCMEMDAIRATVGVAKGTVAAVKAGMDLIFISRTPEEVISAARALEEAVLSGALPEARVDEAVGRVLAAKARYLRPLSEAETPDTAADLRFAEAFSMDAIARSRRGGETFALGERPLFISPLRSRVTQVANLTDGDYAFASAMESRFGGAARIIGLDPDPAEAGRLADEAAAASSVVLGTVNGNVHPGQMALAARLAQSGVPFALVALRNPFELALAPAGCFALALYEYAPDTAARAMAFFHR